MYIKYYTSNKSICKFNIMPNFFYELKFTIYLVFIDNKQWYNIYFFSNCFKIWIVKNIEIYILMILSIYSALKIKFGELYMNQSYMKNFKKGSW